MSARKSCATKGRTVLALTLPLVRMIILGAKLFIQTDDHGLIVHFMPSLNVSAVIHFHDDRGVALNLTSADPLPVEELEAVDRGPVVDPSGGRRIQVADGGLEVMHDAL
mmetsp:Transcript_4252/g.8051  ORF Transcript_4252/g.8051 Transcript_4252/m.8051 type:complete len:109 (+) Transcript_4252:211-537(+)